MYKISKYNQIMPMGDGRYIAYSARSGALGLMDEKNYQTCQSVFEKIRDGDESRFTPEESHLVRQLEYGRFIYHDYYDELKELKFQHHMARFDQSSLGLSIAPTLACNMDCGYCYEGNKKGRMQPEIIESILDFIETRAVGLRSLDINWYGGEPLLAMEIIEDLTESMLDLGEEYKFGFNASMITNGYLLTKENTDRLVNDFKVSNIQITLDGPSDIHNKKRPLKNGKDSFDTILKNIQYSAGKMQVNIRVNIDKSFTVETIQKLLDELDQVGLKNIAGLYFGRIEAATSACSNISESCYGAEDFSKIETDFYRLLLENGFTITSLPQPMATVCFSQLISSHLIDPEGYIYKCYNYVGDLPRAMGNIKENINYSHPNFTRLFNFDAFEDEECRSCSILPICMGGCPARRADGGLKSGEACETWKHNLGPMLEIIARSRQSQAQKAAKETT
jgi:uncharacterized protein